MHWRPCNKNGTWYWLLNQIRFVAEAALLRVSRNLLQWLRRSVHLICVMPSFPTAQRLYHLMLSALAEIIRLIHIIQWLFTTGVTSNEVGPCPRRWLLNRRNPRTFSDMAVQCCATFSIGELLCVALPLLELLHAGFVIPKALGHHPYVRSTINVAGYQSIKYT